MTKAIPPKLYKYQSYNVHTLDNLKNRHLWFSKPERFNDPFDYLVANDISYEVSSSDNLNNLHNVLRKFASNKSRFDGRYSEGLKPNATFKYECMNLAEIQVRKEIQKYRQEGVACFSETVDDILMWAHYSDGHRGFCLEFDTSHSPFQNVLEVCYSDSYPLINPIDVLLQRLPNWQNLLFTTKSTQWSYEREWRVIIDRGDQPYQIDPSALTGVYFGCAMPNVHEEIIAMILAKHPTHLYEMRQSDTEFKVTIEDFLMPRSSL